MSPECLVSQMFISHQAVTLVERLLISLLALRHTSTTHDSSPWTPPTKLTLKDILISDSPLLTPSYPFGRHLLEILDVDYRRCSHTDLVAT